MLPRTIERIALGLAVAVTGAATVITQGATGQAGQISAPEQVESRFTGFSAFYSGRTAAYYPMGNYGPGDVAEATIFATGPTRATLICVRSNNGSVQRRSIVFTEEGTLSLRMSTYSFCVLVLVARDQGAGPTQAAIDPVFN